MHDKFDEKYGPGLSIIDFNLGILYMLAVSSLATYGILLAGSPERNIKHMLLSIFTYFNIRCLHLFFLIFRCIIFYYWLF